MDYRKIHDSIIKKAKERVELTGYGENHHITPRSMGGSDSSENIVRLTAREHFVVHWLLSKIHNNSQMIFALFAMTKSGNKTQKRYTSHSFKYAREAVSAHMSETRTGQMHPLYGIRGEANPNFGSKRTDEQRRNISLSRKGKSGDLNHKSKRVVNLTTGEIHQSIRIAQSKSSGNVSYAIRTGGTAGGCKYAYCDENGRALAAETKLKGYMKGGNHVFASRVINETTGDEYETIKDAGLSIGKTGSAISWAIKNNKCICGFRFKRL